VERSGSLNILDILADTVGPAMQHKTDTSSRTAAAPEDLPYRVELWRADAEEVERVLARAASMHLARAIFTAAQREHPQRRITLCKGNRVVTDSAE
jgi:chaperone required for assembly of F1-ATPase